MASSALSWDQAIWNWVPLPQRANWITFSTLSVVIAAIGCGIGVPCSRGYLLVGVMAGVEVEEMEGVLVMLDTLSNEVVSVTAGVFVWEVASDAEIIGFALNPQLALVIPNASKYIHRVVATFEIPDDSFFLTVETVIMAGFPKGE